MSPWQPYDDIILFAVFLPATFTDRDEEPLCTLRYRHVNSRFTDNVKKNSFKQYTLHFLYSLEDAINIAGKTVTFIKALHFTSNWNTVNFIVPFKILKKKIGAANYRNVVCINYTLPAINVQHNTDTHDTLWSVLSTVNQSSCSCSPEGQTCRSSCRVRVIYPLWFYRGSLTLVYLL